MLTGRPIALAMIGALVAVLTSSALAVPAHASSDRDDLRIDVDGGIARDRVDLGARAGGGSGRDGSNRGSDRDGDSDSGAEIAPDAGLQPGLTRCYSGGRMLIRLAPCPAPAPDEPARPTLTDIRSFVPQTPTFAGEPDGWALRGRPANFTAPVEAHIVAGTLLGRPAYVLFTPVAWRWDYGDGSTRTTDTGGMSWEVQGVPRFSPTATGHTYARRGEVTVSLNVEYAAAYRYDAGDWTPIEGTLTVPAPSETIRVVTGSTVLAGGPCPPRASATC